MKKLIFATYIFGILAIASCRSTQITSTWREPNKEISLNKLKKVLVVALFKSGVEKMTDEIGKVVFNEMVKVGFINEK